MNRKKRIIQKGGTNMDFVLANMGVPHSVTRTSNTTKVETDSTVWIGTKTNLTPKELGFIVRVKRFCLACGKPRVNVNPSDISYFKFSNISPGIYTGVTELDVNSAYWNIAFEEGYLSRELYEEGKEVSKKCRLVALGALATRKHTFDFDGEKYTYREVGESDKRKRLRSYFFNVAKRLDLAMNEACSSIGSSFLWYWVDAFFVKIECKDELVRKMRDMGLELGEKPTSYIHVKYDKATNCDIVTCNFLGDQKSFTKPRKEGQELIRYLKFNRMINNARRQGIIREF